MNVVEIFTGAGGLAMGVGQAGFKSKAVIEWDKWACDTLRENRQRNYPLVSDWNINQCDVRDFDFEALEDKIDLVAGGPPCQPFSLGGKHRGKNDNRNMFPITVDAIRRLRPKSFIIENVRGLTRASFANYFQYIVHQLTYPEVFRRSNENWMDHLARLEKTKTSGKKRGLTYQVVYRVLNAANFGVPQKRERVFIIGFRNDISVKWSFPDPSHSFDALLEEKWISGDYWENHKIAKRDRAEAPDRFKQRIENIRKTNLRPSSTHKPWQTVRDALVGLPDPQNKKFNIDFHNHRYQAGARQYAGHTGSPLDLPAKALKAGDHGVPGGENMMVLDDGSVRYFTVREAARLQTFPDGYLFHGSWTETMRQLGNAVPIKLAHVVAKSVAIKLIEHEQKELGSLINRLAR